MASMLLRSVYAKRAAMNPKFIQLAALRAMSASSLPNASINPHGWKSWKDIPDSALPKSPDPNNGVYETSEYKKVQRKRIWYQIPDGTPIYFKEGMRDRVLVYSYVTMLFSLLSYEFYAIVTQVAV